MIGRRKKHAHQAWSGYTISSRFINSSFEFGCVEVWWICWSFGLIETLKILCLCHEWCSNSMRTHWSESHQLISFICFNCKMVMPIWIRDVDWFIKKSTQCVLHSKTHTRTHTYIFRGTHCIFLSRVHMRFYYHFEEISLVRWMCFFSWLVKIAHSLYFWCAHIQHLAKNDT